MMNFGVEYPEVRVLTQDEEGKEESMVMPTAEALKKAQGEEKDLILVTPGAKPPICKIIEYGKWKYDKEKLNKEAKRKQRETRVDIKEMKMTVGIDVGDYQTKIRKTRKYLVKDGNKVKVLVKLKGRDIFKDNAKELLDKYIVDVGDDAIVETAPRRMGRDYFMLLQPVKAKVDAAKAEKDRKAKARQEGEATADDDDDSDDDDAVDDSDSEDEDAYDSDESEDEEDTSTKKKKSVLLDDELEPVGAITLPK